jgi:hypothetical protein
MPTCSFYLKGVMKISGGRDTFRRRDLPVVPLNHRFYRIFQNGHVASSGWGGKHRRQRATLYLALREHFRVQHPKRDRVSFPRRRGSRLIESAVHDLIQGIPAFWADKSIARVGGQIFKAFLVVCKFALIAMINDPRHVL